MAKRGMGAGFACCISLVTSAALALSLCGIPAGMSFASENEEHVMAPRTLTLAPQANTVELYSVTVEGGIGGWVGVGDTLSANAKKIKTAPGSTQTYQAPLEEGDEVAYQWQYASTKTGADASYTDIEGATSLSYTITANMQGKYLRVKVTSGSVSVVSTKVPYYGSTQSVDPAGPVQEAAGAVELSSVALASSSANSMWVGATVTPTAKYQPKGKYLEEAVPADARVTYIWKVANAQTGPYEPFDTTEYPQSVVSNTGELTVGQDLLGKYIRVEANATVNTKSSLNWRVLPQGVYDLLRITFSSDSNLFTGDRLNTNLKAKDLDYENEASNGIAVPYDNPNIVYEWFFGSDASGEQWTAIPNSDVPDLLSIPDEAVGNYLKVVAKSTSDDTYATTVERVTSKPVQYRNALSSAPTRLSDAFFKPVPRWGEVTNLNKVVAAKLESFGFENVTVKTKSFTPSVESEKAHLGVSAADDATNGDVMFFTYDNAAGESTHNYAVYHQGTVVFELSRLGETPVEYSVSINIPWDLDAAKSFVDDQVKDLAVEYAEGESKDNVTQNLTLPCKAGILWTTWESNNTDVVSIYRDESSSEFYWDPYTGIVKAASENTEVTLTATVEASLIDSSDDSLAALNRNIEFPLTVIGDSELIAREIDIIKEKVDANYTTAALKDFATGTAIDADSVESDLQLPRPALLLPQIDSGKYRVVYSANDSNALGVNGNRAYVYRPLPDTGNVQASLTVTVTRRDLAAVTYSKTISFMVKALSADEIDQDIAYMDQVKEAIFQGYSEGKQDASAVTENLHSFQRAYFDAEGKLHWKYTALSDEDALCPIGFTPQTVVDNPSSDASYSNFVSSSPYVADSTLYVTRPANDVGVTIMCCLSSDRFGAYYERYANDETCPAEFKEKLRALYRQMVPCNITVKGTNVSVAVREELMRAADAADAAMKNIVVSEDGSDVLATVQWVPEDLMNALQEAIVRARAVAAKETLTDAEILAATENLAQAQNAFNMACRQGLSALATDADRAALAAEADAAEALLEGVYVSTDGTTIDASRTWAPPAAIDALEEAIAAARALAGADAVAQSDLVAATGNLTLVRNAFSAEIKAGTKETQSPASSDTPQDTAKAETSDTPKAGATYAAGSGVSAGKYLVKTIATRSGEGTVWYQSCMLSAKTAKAAIVPDTVTIKGDTYRVVGISSGAFKNMKKLAKVTFGKNISRISKSAFKNTKNLKKIVVKSTLLTKKSLVKGACKGSKAKKLVIKVPAKMKKIYQKVFTKKNLAAQKKVTVTR